MIIGEQWFARSSGQRGITTSSLPKNYRVKPRMSRHLIRRKDRSAGVSRKNYTKAKAPRLAPLAGYDNYYNSAAHQFRIRKAPAPTSLGGKTMERLYIHHAKLRWYHKLRPTKITNH